MIRANIHYTSTSALVHWLVLERTHARSTYYIPYSAFIRRRIPKGNILIKSQLAKSELIVLHQIIIIGLTSGMCMQLWCERRTTANTALPLLLLDVIQ